MTSSAKELLRNLPAIGEVLERADVVRLRASHTHEAVAAAVRVVVARWREQVRSGEFCAEQLDEALGKAGELVGVELLRSLQPRLRRVINATGVLLQTNLGRAPLSARAVAHMAEVANGYCNLEYDLERGERSRRDVLVEDLLLDVLDVRRAANSNEEVQAAAVVNNCAAATFLALNTLAEGGEVVVSRGELVEIGGGFRVPEILAKSGAMLREVGTTNKTRVADYAAVIGPQTRMILRVHRSNFEIRGFTEQPSLEELVALGKRVAVPVFEDQGTGCLVDLETFGLHGESSLRRSVRSGASLVAASGDKLLGGPQCGLLVGSEQAIAKLRSNPLFRALRVDKLTYAALEATLMAYRVGDEDEIPVLGMLRTPAEAIRRRCERWADELRNDAVRATVVETRCVIGGGTTPGASVASFAVSLRVAGLSEAGLAARLRGLELPVVARVNEGQVLLDLRTVAPADDDVVLAMLRTEFVR